MAETTTQARQTEILEDFYQLFINGENKDSSNGETFEVVNPATGEVLTKVSKGTREDADAAVEAARTAFETGRWPRQNEAKRARLLNKIAAGMRKRFNELVDAEVLNTGKTVEAAQGQIMQAVQDFEYYAGVITTLGGKTNPMPNGFFNYTLKEPVGVCAQIIPWNYPLMMAAWKVAPALAAGCTVILKPASYTPITAYMLADICKEAGVPDGVVNVLTGSGSDIGSYLTEHPKVDKVAFTGETETGKDIMAKASQTLKRVTLELGGKSPNLVFNDSNIDNAVEGSLYGIFYNTGQSCEARSRLFVQEDIYDEFMEKFLKKAAKLNVGDPFDDNTHMGAVISKSQESVIDDYVQLAKEEGGEILFGGKRPEGEEYGNGFWYEPTIIGNVSNDMRIAQEEIFGPVVVVMTFKDEKEAIKLANDTQFGLGSAIWTNDNARAVRVSKGIKAGIVMVNQHISAFPGSPFGGYKQSGFGRELGEETLDLYMETKSVISYIGERPLHPFGDLS
ncbi:aldehyde dehydrogenase family protein [Lentibacillus salinarum]|uniref:Aldehyde dehydrogenase family protein n=1 Tax=Lentibacillus salinarum TaxID=446820 RepID=A0ABW3ZRF2_9BACI